MRVNVMAACGLLMGLGISCGAQAQEKTVSLATLEWPPYVGAALPEEGATTAVIKKAFETAGYKVEVIFLPWKRAVEETAEAGGKFDAFYPGYNCNQKPGLVSSESLGSSPLGFAENAEAPLAWSSLDDLAGKRVGTVQGYTNTAEFDERVAMGKITADAAVNDLTNLKKLVAKRLDAVIVDRFVMEYMLKTEKDLAADAGKIAFNKKPLEEKNLFLCFRDDSAGKKVVADFDAALATIDVPALIDAYFKKL